MNREEMKKVVLEVVERSFKSENDIFVNWSPHCNQLTVQVFQGKWGVGNSENGEHIFIYFDHDTEESLAEKLGRIK